MEQFYKTYWDNHSNTPEYNIKFYNENFVRINNITRFDNKEDLYSFVLIYYQFISAFVLKSQYKNAIKALNKLPLIETFIDEFEVDRAGFDNYRWLLNMQARALYNLKRERASKKIFDQLLIYEPENDNIKLWRQAAKLSIIQKYSLILGIFSLVAMAGQMLSKYMNHIVLNHICTYVASVCFLIFGIINVIIYIKRNKKISL
jgi:hypothetical protein